MSSLKALLEETDELLASFEQRGSAAVSLMPEDQDLLEDEDGLDDEIDGDIEIETEEAHGKRQPIFNPRHNMREVAKELILLEDHLFQPPRHCPDCIRKHLMKAEALAEEAVTLDKGESLGAEPSQLAQQLRGVHRAVLKGAPKARLAQTVRKLRKSLAKRFGDAVAEDDEGVKGSATRWADSATLSTPGTAEGRHVWIWNHVPKPTTWRQRKAWGWLMEGDIELGDYLDLFDAATKAHARRRFRSLVRERRGDLIALRDSSKVGRIERALVLAMSKLAEEPDRLGSDPTTAGIWTPSKARDYAKMVFAQAGKISRESGWSSLIARISEGSMYPPVEGGTDRENAREEIITILHDVQDRLRWSRDEDERYEALYTKSSEQIDRMLRDVSAGRFGPSATSAVTHRFTHGTKVLARSDGRWFRAEVMERGSECGGYVVADVPDSGTFPVVYVEGGDCEWVSPERLMVLASPPVSGLLHSTRVTRRNVLGRESRFAWTPDKLLMADLIESVMRHDLGDVCEHFRVPGCEKLSIERRSALMDKLVLAAIVNAIYESGLDPTQIGDGGRSVGLFQLYDGGVGHGMSVEQRVDPVKNTVGILGEFKRQLKNSKSRFMVLQEREISAPTLGASAPAWEWAEAFTIDVENPKSAEAKGKNRAWTLASMLGAPKSVLDRYVPPLPPPAPRVAVVAPPPAAPASPTLPQESGWSRWRQPVLTTATVSFGLAAVALGLKAISVQAEATRGIAEGRYRRG